IVELIIQEFNLRSNPEQLRAFNLIARHFVSGSQEQLLLYIAGVGGSGKSFVIHAVVELFKRCGMSDKLLLSAPTGCAAVLIDGFTIHALTFLPKKKDEKPGMHTAELNAIWKNVRYLILDEISMVSAPLLADICNRLNEALGERLIGVDALFGDINVILLGDMGQLRPVNSPSLFSRELVNQISPNVRETTAGVGSLYGAWIWREFRKVVILRKNFRSLGDPAYTNLLARVRLGKAWDGNQPLTSDQLGVGPNYLISDFQVLQSRQLQRLPLAEREMFADAPIICSTKLVRDFINRRLTLNHAQNTRTEVHDYHARDKFSGLDLTEALSQCAWQMRSTDTDDALGKLPLSIGMRVMVTENLALKISVVNGAEGVLREIHYSTDSKGRRYADCAYVEIPGSNFNMDGRDKDIVPIVPFTSYFRYKSKSGRSFPITRKQLPLLPAYAFTDYKAQGKSLRRVIVDLNGARSLQSLYVMISRATSLKSVAVLRNFTSRTLYGRLGEEFRDELARLERLDAITRIEYEASTSDMDTSE
ncbi:PIF1-like helicase-domain-containing protein, partial [Favolaschia claudopus]